MSAWLYRRARDNSSVRDLPNLFLLCDPLVRSVGVFIANGLFGGGFREGTHASVVAGVVGNLRLVDTLVDLVVPVLLDQHLEKIKSGAVYGGAITTDVADL